MAQQQQKGGLEGGIKQLTKLGTKVGQATILVEQATDLSIAVKGLIDVWRSNPEKAKYEEMKKVEAELVAENEKTQKRISADYDSYRDDTEKRINASSAKIDNARQKANGVITKMAEGIKEMGREHQNHMEQIEQQFKEEMNSKELKSDEERREVELKFEEMKKTERENHEKKVKQAEKEMQTIKEQLRKDVEKEEEERKECQQELEQRQKEHHEKMRADSEEFYAKKMQVHKELIILRKKLMERERQYNQEIQNEQLQQIQSEYNVIVNKFKDLNNQSLMLETKSNLLDAKGNICPLIVDVLANMKMLKENDEELYRDACRETTEELLNLLNQLKHTKDRMDTYMINNSGSDRGLKKHVTQLSKDFEDGINKLWGVKMLQKGLQAKSLPKLDSFEKSLSEAHQLLESGVQRYQQLDFDGLTRNFDRAVGEQERSRNQIE